MTKQYYVYIMTNKSRTLYTGVTNNLELRAYEHKQKLIPGFTSKYNIARLVYFEATQDIRVAIEREKQIIRMVTEQENRPNRVDKSAMGGPEFSNCIKLQSGVILRPQAKESQYRSFVALGSSG